MQTPKLSSLLPKPAASRGILDGRALTQPLVNSTLIRRFLRQITVTFLTRQIQQARSGRTAVSPGGGAGPRGRRACVSPSTWCALGGLGLLGASLLGCGSPEQRAAPPADHVGTVPAPARLRLLTRSEYQRTVSDLLGSSLDVTRDFPPEPVVSGFSNNAESHQMNPLLLEQLRGAALALADEATQRGFDALAPCASDEEQASCARVQIQAFATRAFRRPVLQDELDLLFRLYDRAAAALSPSQALGAVIESVLVAPQFLYRVEAPAAAVQDDHVQLGPYELASRLSYFLTGSMPDPELLGAADSGALLDRVELESQARRLLGTVHAPSRVREFHAQWLGLDRLNGIARDGAPADMNSALLESVQRYLDDVFWSETSSVQDLYAAPQLFLNETLAPLYAGTAPVSGWTRLENPEQRAGLLLQPALLALLAHPDQSAPVKRGVFVRDAILCAPVAAPPPTVNNTPPDPDPSMTTRERFAVHTADVTCSKCHSLIDPMGFGFEAYDQLGRYRTTENGISVDATGAVVDLAEEALNGPFDGATQLALRVADSQTALDCLGQKWFTFALGRSFTVQDRPSLNQAVDQARAAGGSLQELLVALTTTDAFQWRAAHDLDGSAL